MQRKWMILAAAMFSMTALTVGFATADDEDSPLHKLMERINKKSNDIGKAARTAVAYKKAQKDVATHAEDLVKLSKDATPLGTDVIKKAKDVANAQGKWKDLMSSFTTSAENLAKVASKADAKQEEVKSAHTAVKKVCTECHNIFRVEE